MAVSDRMNDMVERYGEVCPQNNAAQILSVSTRTIARMADDGRLRRVGAHIDVRSICEYIENSRQMDFQARYQKKYPPIPMPESEFYAASRGKRAHSIA